MHKIALLGTGLIGRFYTMSLLGYRGRDEIVVVCAIGPGEAERFAKEFGIPRWTTDMADAIRDPEVDTVIVGLPNFLHKKAVLLAAEAGKNVLCTKPLATNATDALEMLEAVEKAGVFHGYLEDLVYTPKTLKALDAANKGALGKILWARSRETHAGPHSDWFWNQSAIRRRRHHGYGLPLHRNCPRLSRQGQPAPGSHLLGGYPGAPD